MSNARKTSLSKRLKWRVEWLVQTGAEGVIARLPGPGVFRFGEWIGEFLWRMMRQRRIIVRKNLRIALAGEEDPEEIRVLARRSFVRSVANLLSAAHTARLSADVLESRVSVENPEVLEDAIRGGNGCILLPPHMGNWEILARISRLFPPGHEQGALYRPLNNPYLNARLTARRRSEGTRMFSKRDSLLEITRFLRNGGIIGILADQRAGPQGVVSHFFGRLTRSSPLPYLLIRRCKVPALAVSIRTLRPGHWALRYHPVAGNGSTQDCMDAIERAMRESLVDVFWFQDRWKSYASHLTPIRDWLGGDDDRSPRHPHRALFWQAGMPSCGLPPEWRHPDVAYELALHEGEDPPAWADEAVVVHRVPRTDDAKALRGALTRIDRSAALPLDFVLSPQPVQALHRTCRRLALAHVAISSS